MNGRFCVYNPWSMRNAGDVDMSELPPLGEPCDGCGKDAVLRIVLGSGKMLTFCAACWHKHETALREESAAVRG